MRSADAVRIETSPAPVRRRWSIARIVGTGGRALVAAGLLLLYYTIYMLWGTGLYTAQAQAELAERVAAAPIVAERPDLGTGGPIPPAVPATPPRAGDPLFTMVIPKLALRSVVVQGIEVEDLKLGPGHYPDTPWPGEKGNFAIAGHRTTYGAPFFRLDEMAPGDPITIEAGAARYRYTVSEVEIVTPDRTDVVGYRGRDELTLTTCHPRYSAAKRLIVHARYEGAEAIVAAEDTDAPSQAAGREVPAVPRPVPAESWWLAGASVAAMLAAAGLSKRFRVAAGVLAGTMGTAVMLWVVAFPQIVKLMPPEY